MLRLAGPLPRLVLAATVIALLLLSLRVSVSPSVGSLHRQWAWVPEKVNTLTHAGSDASADADLPVDGEGCEGIAAGLERVVITVKTGATEAGKKIPVQMRTSLRCAPHVLVFSDMAQKIGDIELHDVLDETADSIKDGNPAFEIYRKQQEMKDPQRIMNQLTSFKVPGTKDGAAWNLDKYKNIHLVEKAWKLKPGMDWYLHVDADTYVMLPSLAEWVKRLDPKKHLYLGRSLPMDGGTFAHGGTGILLSGEAMRTFAIDHAGLAARWDPRIEKSCCGDMLLSHALLQIGIPPALQAWPSMNGESPNSLPFGERLWCEPIVTMHHVTVDEMESAARFEMGRRDKTKPVTFEEFFKGVPIGDFPEKRKHWDNVDSDDREKRKPSRVDSYDACVAKCTANESCLQGRFDGWDECMLMTTGFAVGKERMPEWPKRWDSFWNATRIERWVASQPACPEKFSFPHQLVRWTG